MTSFHLKTRWGILRTGQLCTEIFNDKLNKALQYAVRSSIYDPELTLKELTTAQSLLLSLLYGLSLRDIPFCLNIIEASSAVVQLRSSYIKVWLKDDFNFKRDDVAKAFSNLATLMSCKFPSQLELPPYVTVAFSGLIDKYKLFDVFNFSGDETALEFVKELNTYVLELAKNLETTLQVEENTNASVDSHLEVNVEASAIVDNESTLSPTLPEIQRLVINDEEVTASLPRCEVANEASGSSSPAPMPSSSRLEVQTNNCDNKESTSSSTEPKIEAPKKKFIWVKRDAVPFLHQLEVANEASGSSCPAPTPSSSQFEVQASNCDNKESTSSSALPKTKVLRKFVRVEVDASSLPRAEDIGGASSPSAPPDTTPPMIQAGNEASGSSSSAPTPSSSRLEDVCESTRSCNAPVPSWYNEDDIKTCLENAVRHNDLTTITMLLELGFNINEETEFGQRFLHLAVYSGCIETVSKLLEFGALPHLKNNDCITPLQLAVQLNTPPIIELLLMNGSDVNEQFSDGNSLLHKTASSGALHSLNTLLKFKPALDFQNNDGHTALHLATKAECLNAMQALINAGAAVNILSKESESCLHISVISGNVEAINMLMRAKANPYLKQKSGLNAFHLTHNLNILNSFVSQGVSVNTRTSKEDTLLHLVAFKGNTELAKQLIELHAIVNATNKERNSPLVKAIEGGHTEMVRLLINAGAHVNYVNPLTKDAPIHLAAETGKIECVRLLLDAGVNVNTTGDKKWAPIHNAAQGGYSSMVSLLIERGADVNLRNDDNDTPLHWAAYNGFRQTAKILIDNGADINAKGDFGNTPLKVATGVKKISVINLLKRNGALL